MDARAPLKETAAQATPWRLLALLMAMTAIGPATLNMMVPALPGLTTTLGTDAGTVQLTLSLFLLSLASAQLLAEYVPAKPTPRGKLAGFMPASPEPA